LPSMGRRSSAMERTGNDSRSPYSSPKDDLAEINVHPKGTCDKCDGPHMTDDCPIFKKARDDHPDAKRGNSKGIGDVGGDNFILRGGRVVPQPGDGSCLFHSLAFGIGGRATARELRRDICNFVERNAELSIADTPLKDWIKWDGGGTVTSYARRMAIGGWGGGIEMAAFSQMRRVNVHVFERCSTGFKRISAFNVTGAAKTIRVLYRGGVHYDALE